MTENNCGQEERNSATGIALRVTDDRMHVLVSCDSDALSLPDLYEQILARLKDLRVTLTPDRDAFEKGWAEARGRVPPQLTDHLLVSGVKAVEAENGWLEWSRDYFDTHYPVDPKTGQIDFKGRVGNPSVLAGDLLVKVHRAKPGVPGSDLFGTVLPISTPVEARITPAENVAWDEESGGYRAASEGRVSFRDQKLAVDPVLHIAGDVSGGTGNILHNGSVSIRGDVDAGYSVQATGDIEVRGMVYDAELRCGGNLAIVGGVNGNTHAAIEVYGDFHAKFILNATVRSRGDIVVEREIYRSQVETCGEVKIPAGRIVGGQVVATRGITVGEAGSQGDAITVLALKPDREMIAEIAKLNACLAELDEGLQNLRHMLREYKKQGPSLSDMGKKRMAKAAVEMIRMEKEVAARTREKQTIVRHIDADQAAVIQVVNHIYPGAWFKIHHGDLQSEAELLGPIMARLDRGKGAVVLMSPDQEMPEQENVAGTKAAA